MFTQNGYRYYGHETTKVDPETGKRADGLKIYVEPIGHYRPLLFSPGFDSVRAAKRWVRDVARENEHNG